MRRSPTHAAGNYFVYSIMQPYVEEFRQKANAPEFLKNVQKVVESSPEGKERITVIRKRMAEFARCEPRQPSREPNSILAN